MDKIKIRVIEDIKDTCGKKIIARKGRIGYIDKYAYDIFGVGEKPKMWNHLPTKLEGNKIHRDIPNYKMELAEE